MIAMKGLGGWSDALADSYIDARERRFTFGANTPEEAVEIAFREAALYREKYA
jgi:hypothetical protein